MSTKLCMDIINATDVSLCTVQIVGGNRVTCLKSDKIGFALLPETIDKGYFKGRLIHVAQKIVDLKYSGNVQVNGDKELSNAYSTKLNSLMTQKIAWCLGVLNNPGAWVNYNRLENPQPYEVFDDANGNFFDIASFDAKEGPFILRINNKEEFKSNEFDEFVKKQLRALWQKARDQEQGK